MHALQTIKMCIYLYYEGTVEGLTAMYSYCPYYYYYTAEWDLSLI